MCCWLIQFPGPPRSWPCRRRQMRSLNHSVRTVTRSRALWGSKFAPRLCHPFPPEVPVRPAEELHNLKNPDEGMMSSQRACEAKCKVAIRARLFKSPIWCGGSAFTPPLPPPTHNPCSVALIKAFTRTSIGAKGERGEEDGVPVDGVPCLSRFYRWGCWRVDWGDRGRGGE